MKNTITFIFLTMTLTLLAQVSNVYAQKSTNEADECKETQQGEYCIEFSPVNYKGNYYVNNKRYYGDKTLKLTVKSHSIIIGWDGDGNLITLQVKDGGELSVSNESAIKASNRKLVFNNVSIAIDPIDYDDYYYPSPYNLLPELQRQSGKKPFTLVPNLKYYVEIYGRGTDDELLFHVGDRGKISEINNPRAATAVGNTLKFENRKIGVTSPDYKGEIVFGGILRQLPIKSITIVPYITIPISFPGYSKGKLLIRMQQMIVPEDLILGTTGKSKKSYTFVFTRDK